MDQNLDRYFKEIIYNDAWMIAVLKLVRDLNLNDCWIGAGFVRNKIWDHLHGEKRTKLNDIDVIYYDHSKSSKECDLLIENKLKIKQSILNWSVKNQARMHIKNKHNQYTDCNEAISFWPETATSLAVRLNAKNQIRYIAPYGLEDLFNLTVNPTPHFDLTTYNERVKKKGWIQKWNRLEINTTNNMVLKK
ncbi:nucleotidyltransferase family protein [Aquimarina addita]|uniref:Nucleotidyltransferase family protein n=1 Tax=Aquimarina addita TaxID=870485 RepID=A0ABP6UP37_9FLAO